MNKEEIDEIEEILCEFTSLFELGEVQELIDDCDKVNNYIKQLTQKNKQLKSIIKTLIKEYELEPTEYVKDLLKGEK